MPILDRDEKTRKYADEGELMFEIRCDCAAEGAGCAHLDHSLVSWGDADDDPEELFITLVPRSYPWGFVERIKEAWCILSRGNFRFRDDMCLEVGTVEGWANRLQEIARRMREKQRTRLLEPLETEVPTDE